MWRPWYRKLIFFLIGSFLVSSCALAQSSRIPSEGAAWQYTDLRIIDPVDAPNPNQDLVAAYIRQVGERTEIRLDFLELAEIPDFDLYLALDISPSGETELPIHGTTRLAWDALLSIPARGALQIIPAAKTETSMGSLSGSTPEPGMSGLHILREPRQDNLTISFDQPAAILAARGAGFEVFLTEPGSKEIIDQVGPVLVASPPPPPATVILAFWNTLPAYTPIQTLRRWDGAHTGPLGGRHGLFNLLRTASNAGAPLFLLDLTQPASLSALDASGGIDPVLEMEQQGLLSLPEVLPGLPYPADNLPLSGTTLAELAKRDQAVRQSFGFSTSSALYLPAGTDSLPLVDWLPDQRQSRVLFLPMTGTDINPESGDESAPIQPLAWDGRVIIPLISFDEAGTELDQLDRDGLTLDARRAAVKTAQQTGQQISPGYPILVLGGDLTGSAWGDPQAARAAFQYIQNHPWMRLLGPDQLNLLLPSGTFNPSETTELNLLSPENAELVNWLHDAPANNLGKAAWQAYRAMYALVAPVDTRLAELRSAYAGQTAVLLKAAEWAENPQPGADCRADLDFDGSSECWIASDQALAVFEMDYGGYLAYLFELNPAGVAHQVIAPSPTLINGTSPGESWDLERGILAEPEALPGAFWDTTVPAGQRAGWETTPNGLKLINPVSGRTANYLLNNNILRAEFSETIAPATSASKTILALNLDPWQRFEPGWSQRYHSSLQENTWTWEISGGPQVRLTTDADVAIQAWSDDSDILGAPGDPNREVQDGFRLPFPIAAAYLDAQQRFWVEISLK